MVAKTLFGFVVAVSLAGCSKDEPKAKVEDKVDTTPSPPPVAPPKVTPEKPPQPIKQSAVGPDLKMLPSDAELVLGLDVATVVQSPVWKTFAEPRVMTDTVKATLAEFKDKCGLDPMAVVKNAVVGIKGQAGSRSGVVVVHGPDKAKVTDCMAKMKDKAEITTDGDVHTVKTKGGEAFAFAFTSDDTAVVVFGPNSNAATVKSAMAATGALDKSQKFVEKFNKLDTTRPAWMLMTGGSKAFDALGAFGIKPIGAYGSAALTNGINLEFRLVLESADKATAFAQMLKGQAAAAKSMLSVDKMEFVNDGADLKIETAVTNDKLPKLLDQMKKMAAMAGGGKAGP
jgi:hypothetical protein